MNAVTRLVLESAVMQLARWRAAGLASRGRGRARWSSGRSRQLRRCVVTLAMNERSISSSSMVVAEGIEDTQALAAVAVLGCDYAQGYHFSRPVPADAFTARARERVADVVAPPLLAP